MGRHLHRDLSSCMGEEGGIKVEEMLGVAIKYSSLGEELDSINIEYTVRRYLDLAENHMVSILLHSS